MPRFGAFPATFPEGSAQTLITFLKGQLADKWDAVEAVYDLLGFGLHSARGIAGRSPMAGVPSEQDACFELESLLRDHARMKAQTPPPPKEEEESTPPPRMVGQLNIPPWFTAFLLQVLQKLLTT